MPLTKENYKKLEIEYKNLLNDMIFKKINNFKLLKYTNFCNQIIINYNPSLDQNKKYNPNYTVYLHELGGFIKSVFESAEKIVKKPYKIDFKSTLDFVEKITNNNYNENLKLRDNLLLSLNKIEEDLNELEKILI